MLYLEKTTDVNYPHSIADGWGDKVYATKEDLIRLVENIQTMLKEEGDN